MSEDEKGENKTGAKFSLFKIGHKFSLKIGIEHINKESQIMNCLWLASISELYYTRTNSNCITYKKYFSVK